MISKYRFSKIEREIEVNNILVSFPNVPNRDFGDICLISSEKRGVNIINDRLNVSSHFESHTNKSLELLNRD
jgi:hypothetical protein